MWFNSWYQLGRIVALGATIYVALVFFLRLSGKRTLGSLNAFDLVVTVALGSAIASTLLSHAVSLAEGLLTLVLLIGAQYVVAWSATRSKGVRQLVKSQPTLLLENGEMLHGALERERLSEDEVRQAVRSSGVGGLEKIAAVVLETDGSMSVIPTSACGSGNALSDVTRFHATGRDG